MKPTALTDQPTGDDIARYAEAEAWRRRVEAGLEDERPECELCGVFVTSFPEDEALTEATCADCADQDDDDRIETEFREYIESFPDGSEPTDEGTSR